MASTSSAASVSSAEGGTVVSLPPSGSQSTSARETTAATPQSQQSQSQPQQTQARPEIPVVAEAEEDLLRDVLDELDKERSKRAEVEADLRHLAEEREALQKQIEEERRKHEKAKPKEEEIVSRHAFIAMESEVKGFKQLVDALTLGKPAIAAAAKATASAQQQSSSRLTSKRPPATLPLHVVRLLEVIPWDPRAQEHIFGMESIYEWQIYDSTRGGEKQKWHSNIRHFPNRLKNLPITKPRPEDQSDNEDRSLLNFLAGGGDKAASLQSPSKHGVLTDMKLSQILKIEVGYPLPQDGGRWEWVGGWRIDKRVKELNHVAANPDKRTVDCDDDGWSYGKEVQDFELLPTELIWDNPGDGYERKIRRRKWSRQRVLVDYPYASERTKQYLKLLAENARLTVTSTKISDQLVETKTKLTEMEEAMMQLKAEKTVEMAKLAEELKQQDDISKTTGSSGQATGKRIQDFLQKKEQVKEIGSKISQWVGRKSSEDFTSSDSLDDLHNDAAAGPKSIDHSMSNSGSLQGSESGINSFNWRKVGRGGLIEKLAGKKYTRSDSLKQDEGSLVLEEEETSLKDEAS